MCQNVGDMYSATIPGDILYLIYTKRSSECIRDNICTNAVFTNNICTNTVFTNNYCRLIVFTGQNCNNNVFGEQIL
jgi:hypothetical protein